MTQRSLNSDQRLSLIIDIQREIAGVDGELPAVMQTIAERSQAIIGADGAMVNIAEGEWLHTVGVSGIARGALDERRPIGDSVARHAIDSGQPILIEDSRKDPRIDQGMRAKVGDESLICVPLFRGQTVIGTLNVMNASTERRLQEHDRQALEIISVVLSAAVSRAAEIEARRAEARAITRFRMLFDEISLGILRLDCDGLIVEANRALASMLSTDPEPLLGTRFADHILTGHRQAFETMLGQLLAGEARSFELEISCGTEGSGELWALLRAVYEPSEGRPSAVAMIENITERKRAEQELIRQAEINQHQALHDPLTGLPNRLLFGERIAHAIAQARRNGTRVAVALMDLDRFKEVNDSLGHPAGDHLLIHVGERMRGSVRETDTVARLGGDEFGMLLPELSDQAGVLPILERIRLALEQPVHVQSLPIAIEASIGIAIFPDHGSDPQTLIQRADVAMYDAKRNGATFTFYEESAHDYDISSLTLVAELRRALGERELLLHYQPKAALASGSVSSVEALVRWEHPERGMIYPDAFIPIAQETSLIGPLTLYVIEEALGQARRWLDQDIQLSISVNLSTRNLLDREFPLQVAALLQQAGVESRWLELEVTESAMLANPGRAKAVLTALSTLGIRLSIDDFGTGYSSLSYLRQLPVDEIKIDRSFVLGMGIEENDAAIVRSTVDLGRNLGLEVVAEGVETLELWERLRDLGCSTAQGYYLSQPMPAAELPQWLRDRDGSAQPA